LDNLFDVEVVVLSNRDERAIQNEDRKFARLQQRTLGVELDAVRAEEQMRVVAVEFGPLVFMDRVFHGKFMQSELD
jgi:hypothetical protein